MTDAVKKVAKAIDDAKDAMFERDAIAFRMGPAEAAINTLKSLGYLSPEQLAIRDAETTRRALEEAAKALVNSKILVEEYSPYTSGKRCGADDQIQSGHDAILALKPAPTGWKLVPEELPAENNKKAVKLALSATVANWPDYMNSLYRVMIGSVK